MKLTLIITTYNWPESLILVLKSVEKQTVQPSEIIIADDGSSNITKNEIEKFRQKSKLNIIHSWQADIGFRVARSRNKAILKSNGDYIILVDGDMILHPEFIKDHIFSAEIGYFVQGSRVLLSRDKTKQIIKNKNINLSFYSLGIHNRNKAIHSIFLAKIFTIKSIDIKGVRSCNMAFYRNDFFNINGFNNLFEGWGREDSELAIRFINSNILRKKILFTAIQYHLWHNENNRATLDANNFILESAIKNSTKWCENGVNSIKDNES